MYIGSKNMTAFNAKSLLGCQQQQKIGKKKSAIDIGRMLDNMILPSLDLFANYKNC